MGYILKNTSGLINTKITDTGRKKLSEGNFKISYFQVGDSEVSYDTLLGTNYNQMDTNILEPESNAQNSFGGRESNKHNIKYPYIVDVDGTNTYGIPFMASEPQAVFNTAVMRGFFTGNTTSETISWSALTSNDYVINSNYIIDMSVPPYCPDTITLTLDECNQNPVREPEVGDFITIFWDGMGKTNCTCSSTTQTISYQYSENTPIPTPSHNGFKTIDVSYQLDPCASPSPTPTPSSTTCPVIIPSLYNTPTPESDCLVSISSCYQMMTYKIVNICQDGSIKLDRPIPNFVCQTDGCYARAIVYPSGMTEIYDSITPSPHWNDDVIDFESVCGTDAFNVNIWNMNIPWSESPAGLFDNLYKDYTKFASKTYLGTKEYLGYASTSGQTFYNPNTSKTATTDTFYYNSLGDKIFVSPNEQKTIAVIHYTNQTIDFFYGEKFALEPYNESSPGETGQARNFKLHIPWLMWHKNPECCNGVTFWVDPPGFDDLETSLFQVNYIYSSKNTDMNNPGIRYYHLWDTFPNPDGYPNRIGKVFPDHKIVVIDDEEIVAAMSYKSNRNWTLPAPRVGLVSPNTCGNDNNSLDGILSGSSQYLHITYRLTNSNCEQSNSLHSNYYTIIQGPNINCNNIQPQNVSVRFGSEFPCLNTCAPINPPCWLSGFQFSQCTTDPCEDGAVIHSDFYPTGILSNGYPVYYNILAKSNIYFDGTNWIWFATDFEQSLILGQDSPLTGFSGFNFSCRTSKQFCINICTKDETCYLGFGVEITVNDIPVLYGIATTYPLDPSISYNITYDYPNFIINKYSGETLIGSIATLYNPSPTESPIGEWTVVVEDDIVSIETYPFDSDCYKTFCNCTNLQLTGLSPNDAEVSLRYIDCDGILQITGVTLGYNQDLCMLANNYDFITTASFTATNESCETTCTPATNYFSLYSTITTTCPPVCTLPTGFFADKFEIICQLVDGDGRPNPSAWKIIDFTSQIESYFVSGLTTQEALTATTFVITPQDYDNAPTYDLNDYIPLVPANYTGTSLNFGDEYYFYGALETDIMATIYEMRYKINLGESEFQLSTNPSWKNGNPSYITEIGLYDDQKNLMIISKLQSPVLRQGIQQFLVKFDF